jgi:trans-2,3-dihydro-3-hydroxyanthranilate isomerase
MELPFAGHPTIGTAYLLGERNMAPCADGLTTMTVEENIGLITIQLYSQNGKVLKAEMIQPIPEVKGKEEDRKCCKASFTISK